MVLSVPAVIKDWMNELDQWKYLMMYHKQLAPSTGLSFDSCVACLCCQNTFMNHESRGDQLGDKDSEKKKHSQLPFLTQLH